MNTTTAKPTVPATRPAAASPASVQLGERMLDEHVHLATLCSEAIAAFEDGDREACDAAYRTLERELEAHLAFEDRELIPALARFNAAEAATLAEDHRRLRARVTELGVGVDLHATRVAAVRGLVIDLGEHARREGALLYRWVDEAFDTPTRLDWIRRLRTL